MISWGQEFLEWGAWSDANQLATRWCRTRVRILRFRHLLEQHGLTHGIFDAVADLLEERRLLLRFVSRVPFPLNLLEP